MRQIAVAVHSGHVPGLGEKARLFVEALAKRCPDAVLLVGGCFVQRDDVDVIVFTGGTGLTRTTPEAVAREVAEIIKTRLQIG